MTEIEPIESKKKQMDDIQKNQHHLLVSFSRDSWKKKEKISFWKRKKNRKKNFREKKSKK